jgi:aspartyl-tRNA synthetase
MKNIWLSETINLIGKEIEVFGWVDTVRDHGKIVFVDLRDRNGLLQCVINADSRGQSSADSRGNCFDIAKSIKPESVVQIKGKIQKRPKHLINPNIATGKIELAINQFEILSESLTPPLAINEDGYQIDELLRLKYRYLDLRRTRLQKNLILRHQAIKFIRDELDKQRFIEIETPILTKSTPEGARDYLVPSRLDKGSFYALPQSPQQYKQLLMVAGLERYFQIAKCFRDEDTRGDRQPEFTQLDMEMSFVNREDVMAINEKLIVDLIKIITPEKKIQKIPFPRISHQDAIEKYNTDRPDLRKDKKNKDLLAFCWIIDFPFFEKTDNGNWTFTHNPFSAPKSECMEWLVKKENIEKIITTQYDVVLNGFEIGGGSIRNHKPEALKKVFEIIGLSENKIEKNFGHMLEALSFGAPTHGGIAWGLDRLIAVLQNEPNIREVIAFPKTSEGRDPMMHSPSEVDKDQLRELGLKIEKEK